MNKWTIFEDLIFFALCYLLFYILSLILLTSSGCSPQNFLTEIDRCQDINHKIDLAKNQMADLDINQAKADGFIVYDVGSKIYDIDSLTGEQLKTVIYYPIEKLSTSPVILFSHGLTGSAESQLYLLKGLARRGNIVVAPDHHDYINYDRIGLLGDDNETHFFSAITNDIGLLIEALFKQSTNFFAPLTDYEIQELASSGDLLRQFYDTFAYRLVDMKSLLDSLETINKSDSDLSQKMDLSRIIMGGHSLGGATSLALAMTDKRIKLIFCLSPASQPFIDNDLSQIEVPILYMSGDLDDFHDYVFQAYQVSQKPKMFQSIKSGGHYIFTDRPFFYGVGLPFLSNGANGLAKKASADKYYPEQLQDYQLKAIAITRNVSLFISAYADNNHNSLELLGETANNPFIAESYLEQ